ncbi:hypothetical protein AGMMS5026_01910 [Endomicrobiia bacterium]|nr:hypothetical protein AGMMS49523_07760 [Endomicrobiia bacterium]GHT12447.1 hypothetical protein AGMMS49571_04440 [Endomicrobiia bacterium]GHT20021.1 hypothetical protein AGMMS49929_05260 [Endomicrobiia bacterium]GHT27133.1 hypothetical protein AGMMS49995_05390 [Endomicrobiia bacterium]GHT29761.1 hypothetical protein AGMMS5026_01910 [Endomicrobiia bacterium]
MNRGALNVKINNLVYDMIKSKISQIYNKSIFFKEKNTISVSVKTRDSISDMTNLVNIIDRYKKFIENKFYNFILFDGALIQIFYRFKEDEIVEHRLAYVPSSITLTSEECYNESIIGMIDMIKDDKIELNKRLNDRATIRFDFDRNNSSEDHPASHLTFISNSCRIPVCSPITPNGFIRFILENFYNFEELLCQKIDIDIIKKICNMKYKLFDKVISDDHKKKLHINYDL